jgi:hypothetical protein
MTGAGAGVSAGGFIVAASAEGAQTPVGARAGTDVSAGGFIVAASAEGARTGNKSKTCSPKSSPRSACKAEFECAYISEDVHKISFLLFFYVTLTFINFSTGRFFIIGSIICRIFFCVIYCSFFCEGTFFLTLRRFGLSCALPFW